MFYQNKSLFLVLLMLIIKNLTRLLNLFFMKSILIILSAIIILFASCSKKPLKSLPAKGGEWDYAATYIATDNEDGEELLNFSVKGTLTFNKNGTFESVLQGENGPSTLNGGTWSAISSTVTMINFFDGGATAFTVTDLKRDSQTWYSSRTISGITEKINLKLSRQ